MAAPEGNPPILDGILSPGEWDGARQEKFSDGSDLLLMGDGDYLYLGIRSRTTGQKIIASVILDGGDEIAIFHSSAALGTALYTPSGELWQLTQGFTWQVRDTANSPAAQEARQAFLRRENWLASLSTMGVPGESEFQIAMPAGSLRLVVALLRPSLSGAPPSWPVGLQDDSWKVELLQGNTPTPLHFAPESWAVVAAPTLTGSLPTPTEAPPAAAASSQGLIAFVSVRDGNGEIYVMNTDGSDQRRLTNYHQWDGFPDWSPDGAQIVYYSYLSDKSWVIKVMDADGGSPHQLTDGGACDGAPHWAPDGTRIAYTSAADCVPTHRDIYVIHTDGTEPRNLTPHPADDAGSSWSPDSRQIAFSSNRDGNYEIYVMDANGGNVRRLTESAGDDHAPAWSPDGTQIAFYSHRDGNDEIYVMDADGSNPRNLTNNPTEDWFPRWSPDGGQITFSSKRGGNLDIYVMNADGSDVRRLTDSPREDFNSVWQPLPTGAHGDTWIRSYEGEILGTVLDGVATADGGYLFVGSIHYTHDNRDDEDVYLLKTDALGEPRWEKTLGGEHFDRGSRIIQAAGGGFLVFGETRSRGAGKRDLYLLQIDADGDVLWEQAFGGPAEEMGQTLRRTADGGVLLVGQTASFGAGGTDVYVVKTDAQGNEAWSQTYGSELDEEGYAAVELPAGGFLVLGALVHEGRDYVAQDPDVYLVRTDESGEPLWSRVLEQPGAQGGHRILAAADGSLLIFGLRLDASSSAELDPLLLAVDAEGDILWEGAIGEANVSDYTSGVLPTADGGYVLTGMAMRGSLGSIPLCKIDAAGQLLWRKTLSERPGQQAGLTILESPAGGYLVIGTASDGGRGWYTILIKTDNEGNVAK